MQANVQFAFILTGYTEMMETARVKTVNSFTVDSGGAPTVFGILQLDYHGEARQQDPYQLQSHAANRATERIS